MGAEGGERKLAKKGRLVGMIETFAVEWGAEEVVGCLREVV
jgi:hypothetical protein